MQFLLQRRLASCTKKDEYIPLPMAFSIDEDKLVYFSTGNLLYQASTNTWQFAEHQWDYVGSDNSNISESNSGWIDLFGWGTSGYHDSDDSYNVNYQPWSASNSIVNQDYNKYGYGPSTNMLSPDLTETSANYDWGVYNPIVNGGGRAGLWRTLTCDEWKYVFNTRTTTSGIRYAKAQVNGVNGVILLPDDWSEGYYLLNDPNSSSANYNVNTISLVDWETLEQYGAVFLPAAGSRSLTSVSSAGSEGYYWSASYCENDYSWFVYFYNSFFDADTMGRRHVGYSVRLVKDAIIPNNNLLTFIANTNNSSVTFASLYSDGSGVRASLEYSINGIDWIPCELNKKIALKRKGNWVLLRGINTTMLYTRFNMTGSISATGDITSVLNNVGGDHAFESLFVFAELFYNCTSLTTPPNLPTTTLTLHCYRKMFYRCSGLLYAPNLPAEILKNYCYNEIFRGCQFELAPRLPAIQLAQYCYQSMFAGNQHLNSLPELPATVLLRGCYDSMFMGCTGLTYIPKLPATQLALGCYLGMFENCTGITNVYGIDNTAIVELNCASMFSGCTSLVSVEHFDATSARRLACDKMFQNCTSLTSIPRIRILIFTSDVPTKNVCEDMFRNCTSMTSYHVATLHSLCKYMFRGNTNCLELIIDATTPPTITGDVLNGLNPLCIIYVPDSSVEAYKAKQYWSDRSDYIRGISERPNS